MKRNDTEKQREVLTPTFGLFDIASITSRDMSWIRVKLDAPWQFHMTPPLSFHWIKEGPK